MYLSHYLSRYVSILQCIYPLNANNFALYLFIYIFCIVSIYLSIYSAMYLPICYRWEFCFCVGEWVSGSRFPPPPPHSPCLSVYPFMDPSRYLPIARNPTISSQPVSILVPDNTCLDHHLSVYLSVGLSKPYTEEIRYLSIIQCGAAVSSETRNSVEVKKRLEKNQKCDDLKVIK